MSTSKKSYANFGAVTISTANSALDGSGTTATLLSGASTGTIVNQLIIKAQGNTSEGMVRFFIVDAGTVTLYKEVYVPANIQSAVEKSFEAILIENIILESGQLLKVSTQNSDIFNVFANGITWEQCTCSDSSTCDNEPRSIVNTSVELVDTANSNLNGTGTIATLFTSPTGQLMGGTMVNSINIKATSNTSEGMVRLFVDNGSTKFLVTEVPIAASTQTAIQPAYRTKSILNLYINPGFSLCASTQNANTFNVRAESTNIVNCDCA